MAGICAAASAIAGTGLLNSVAHTGNSLAAHRQYPGYAGDTLYRDQPQAVSHARVITAPGSSPVTFTKEILKRSISGGRRRKPQSPRSPANIADLSSISVRVTPTLGR
ncbi:hypothetical protein ABID21_000138 [Pseudorhizobium tarimense]|uniref:Uncharacterized protein n=1 Tax=Pseudorhizobium tarimense TaxID=1079109 RepID=A0ABV2H0I1_9HYPH|nr:hypothetical protein [Pseudorhizobium tarimense]MCJ8517387.1 hypothetical protein [Pseudorhizobium tarimense]